MKTKIKITDDLNLNQKYLFFIGGFYSWMNVFTCLMLHVLASYCVN